jgi:hypothetical protein
MHEMTNNILNHPQNIRSARTPFDIAAISSTYVSENARTGPPIGKTQWEALLSGSDPGRVEEHSSVG